MHQQRVNKKKVQTGFTKSIKTYKQHATVQETIAVKLINKLRQVSYGKFNSVLEIGCGPAVLTEKFVNSFAFESYRANDIVKEFEKIVHHIHPKIHFLGGDIETVELPKYMDLIISSSTFQWLDDLPTLLKRLHKILNIKGLLAFTSFGLYNYREIRDVEGKGLHYISPTKHRQLLSEQFDIVWSDSEIIKWYFTTPLSVLQHMKQTGVNSLPEKVWTKADLCRFTNKYIDLFGTELGVPLTYNPLYFIAKPKK